MRFSTISRDGTTISWFFSNHQNPGNNLTARHKENFQALLNLGVGMFVLHHSVAAYPEFPGFEAILGNGSGIFSNADFRRMVKNGLEHVLPCAAGDAREVCSPVVSIGNPARPQPPGETLHDRSSGPGRILGSGVFFDRDLRIQPYRPHSVDGRRKYGLRID